MARRDKVYEYLISIIYHKPKNKRTTSKILANQKANIGYGLDFSIKKGGLLQSSGYFVDTNRKIAFDGICDKKITMNNGDSLHDENLLLVPKEMAENLYYLKSNRKIGKEQLKNIKKRLPNEIIKVYTLNKI